MPLQCDWLGQVVVKSLSTPEKYSFDMKRPMRTVAMEPNFARRGSRAFVSGGLSGNLVLREKGWLGHKETTLHQGDGSIWQVRWRGRLIAWATDNVSIVIVVGRRFMRPSLVLQGVRIYDHVSQGHLAFIDRPADSPRADLFKCNLYWQDDSTLLIGWANIIKVARMRTRSGTNDTPSSGLPSLLVEITAVFKLDCMVAGLVPHPIPVASFALDTLPQSFKPEAGKKDRAQILTSFLIVAYTPPETFEDTDQMTDDRARQARKAAERPEMRIISRAGEELAVDALSITDYQNWGCNDYTIVPTVELDDPLVSYTDRNYVILSPRDLVLVMPRDRRDHVEWLVERARYEEALKEAEEIEAQERMAVIKVDQEAKTKIHLTPQEIGQKYVEHLVSEGM